MVLLALAGLLAMHGITATTASAAAACGLAPIHAVGQVGGQSSAHDRAHDHGHVPGPAAADPAHGPAITTVQDAAVSGSPPTVDHAGMLCLAILAMVLLVGLRGTRRLSPIAPAVVGSRLALRTRSPRAPPDDRQSVLCRWRT